MVSPRPCHALVYTNSKAPPCHNDAHQILFVSQAWNVLKSIKGCRIHSQHTLPALFNKKRTEGPSPQSQKSTVLLSDTLPHPPLEGIGIVHAFKCTRKNCCPVQHQCFKAPTQDSSTEPAGFQISEKQEEHGQAIFWYFPLFLCVSVVPLDTVLRFPSVSFSALLFWNPISLPCSKALIAIRALFLLRICKFCHAFPRRLSQQCRRPSS